MARHRGLGVKTEDKGIQFDNIATPGAPVWRRRLRKPYTCWAVRMELVRQSAELPDGERQLYVRRRLTELDKALSDDEAEALERYLDCEETLGGRGAISNFSGSSRVTGAASPVPDSVMEKLKLHAADKRLLPPSHAQVLNVLARMMENTAWDYAMAGRFIFGPDEHHRAKNRFISAVRGAAAFLAARQTGRATKR